MIPRYRQPRWTIEWNGYYLLSHINGSSQWSRNKEKAYFTDKKTAEAMLLRCPRGAGIQEIDP